MASTPDTVLIASTYWRQSILTRKFLNSTIEQLYRQYLFFNGHKKSSRRLGLSIAFCFCVISLIQIIPGGSGLESRYSGLFPSPFEGPELEAASSICVVLYSVVISGLMFSRVFQPRTYTLFMFLGSSGLVSSYSWSLFVGFANGLPLRTKSLEFVNAVLRGRRTHDLVAMLISPC